MEKFANKTNFKSSGTGNWEGWMYPSHLRTSVNKVVVAKCRPVNVVAAVYRELIRMYENLQEIFPKIKVSVFRSSTLLDYESWTTVEGGHVYNA